MRSRNWLAVFGILLMACVILYLTRYSWLREMGSVMVRAEQPFQADVVSVLGGDWYGNRILKAGELVHQGYAHVVLVSGGGYLYGNYEADMAIRFAAAHGYDPKLFRKLEYPAISTKDEAEAVIREMRSMGVHRYLLVTSLFHTARAGRIFQAAAPDLAFRIIPSQDTLEWDHWWTSREAQKIFLMEFTKTVTSRFGI